MSYARATSCASLDALSVTSENDALIIICDSLDALPQAYAEQINTHAAIDSRVGKQPALLVSEQAPGKRLIVTPTGPLGRDYDDVRRVFEAAKKALS